MRIIGGKHRGRKLAEFSVGEIRPTSDRAREALFNILTPKIVGAEVLDLFCGSGSLGLEAVSRGAGRAHFNDISKNSLTVLNKNISALSEGGQCVVTNRDFSEFLSRTSDRFDIIFIDPPYREDFGARALEIIASRGLLTDEGIAVYERDRAFTGEVEGLDKYDERKYGKAYLTFFKKI